MTNVIHKSSLPKLMYFNQFLCLTTNNKLNHSIVRVESIDFFKIDWSATIEFDFD